MNIQELLMMFCVIAVIAILLYKIYNLMSICEVYNSKIAWLMLASLVIIRMLAFIVFINELNILYTGIYLWVVWLSYFAILLNLIELLMYYVINLPVAKGRYKKAIKTVD
jgi:hypothetical protein